MFTVGPRAGELASCFRRDGSDRALIVDPGDEPDKLLGAIDALGVTLDGILLTHTHFDHVGAVAPVARATGAEVWVPELEKPVLADIMSFVPWPGFGPFESWDAEHTLERAASASSWRASRSTCCFTPGHSPGHVTFSIPDEQAIFSGDVLFQGSVGRTDLPGGDWAHAARVDPLAASTRCRTRRRSTRATWASPRSGAERATNPFLAELARAAEDGRRSSRPRGGRSTCCPRTAGAGQRCAHLRRTLLGRAGYEPIETPVVRGHRAVRARGGGGHRHRPARRCSPSRTRRGRSLTLRPEGTAGVCRAYVEHGMHKLPQPVKLLLLGAVLPPRGAAGGPLPAVHAGRGRGDRLRRARRSTPR